MLFAFFTVLTFSSDDAKAVVGKTFWPHLIQAVAPNYTSFIVFLIAVHLKFKKMKSQFHFKNVLDVAIKLLIV